MSWTPALVTLLLLAVLAAPTSAHDLGPARPPKAPDTGVPPAPDPEVIRQGGDTIADAIAIHAGESHTLTGTTEGYTDDYDEVCPFDGSTAPDVVYELLHYLQTVSVDIDMCYSQYDTKIYVYDENLELIACNDDYWDGAVCHAYTSYLQDVVLEEGLRHYLVIDGYGTQAGYYQCDIRPNYDYSVDCPDGGQMEGEPPLVDDYVDLFNGGCNTPGDPQLQAINDVYFCGTAGWYDYGGSLYRDTDWFTLVIPESGVLTVTAFAEQNSLIYELGPQDCGEVGVIQSAEVYPSLAGWMEITGEPGSTVWFWFGAAGWDPPGGEPQEYTYLLEIPDVVIGTEQRSWTAVKALFD